VQRAQVDLSTKQVTVDYDSEVTDVGELVGLIEAQGYAVGSFEEVSAS